MPVKRICGNNSGGGGGNITSINADTTPAQKLIAGTNITIVDDGLGGHTFNAPSSSTLTPIDNAQVPLIPTIVGDKIGINSNWQSRQPIYSPQGGVVFADFNWIYRLDTSNVIVPDSANVKVPSTDDNTPVGSYFIVSMVKGTSTIRFEINTNQQINVPGAQVISPATYKVSKPFSLMMLIYTGKVDGLYQFSIINTNLLTVSTAPTIAQQQMDYILNYDALTQNLELKRKSNITARIKHYYFRSWGDTENSGISELEALPLTELTDPLSIFFTTMLQAGDVVDLPIKGITGNLTLNNIPNNVSFIGTGAINNLMPSGTVFTGALITSGATNAIAFRNIKFGGTSTIGHNGDIYTLNCVFNDIESKNEGQAIYLNTTFKGLKALSSISGVTKKITLNNCSVGDLSLPDTAIANPLRVNVTNSTNVNIVSHEDGLININSSQVVGLVSNATISPNAEIVLNNNTYIKDNGNNNTVINKSGKCDSIISNMNILPIGAIWNGVTVDLSLIKYKYLTTEVTYEFTINTVLRGLSLRAVAIVPAFTLSIAEQPVGSVFEFILGRNTAITALTIAPSVTNPPIQTIVGNTPAFAIAKGQGVRIHILDTTIRIEEINTFKI